MNKSWKGLLLWVSLMVLGSTAGATALPDYYPQAFRFTGTLQLIDPSRDIIVVADTQMSIPGNLKVHTLNTQYGTINSLRPGMKVGAALGVSRNGRPIITEIWVLPDDYQQHFH